MWVLLSNGLRRWVVGSVAMPLGSKALSQVADRLERAEGRSTIMSKGLRAAASVADKRGSKGQKSTGQKSTGQKSPTAAPTSADRRRGSSGA